MYNKKLEINYRGESKRKAPYRIGDKFQMRTLSQKTTLDNTIFTKHSQRANT